jgi:phosphate transport system protein
MTEHVIKQYEEELGRLRQTALSMGALAGEQLDDVIAAMERQDTALAAKVIEREPAADRLEHQIDALVIRLLALRQPVAIDLREILSGLSLAKELQRICDHAENMAKRLLALGDAAIETRPPLAALGRFAAAMLKDAMQAYADKDADKAQAVWYRDRELDAMYTSVFQELVRFMIGDSRRIAAGMHLMFVARDVERIGDRATNIAEAVRYLVSGVPVEEERPKADATKSMMVSPER